MLQNLIKQNKINFDLLEVITKKPNPFTPGEEMFWNDPYISEQMLTAHINPNIDAASRKKETIEKTVKHITSFTRLKTDSRFLDLGCGPGLYTSLLAENGFRVTGIDYSNRSINYAKDQAKQASQEINYVYGNYLNIDFDKGQDCITLIYGDICVLSPYERDILIKKIYEALVPGGYFIFDVTTRQHRNKEGIKNNWYVSENCFWRKDKHFVLEMGFDYPEINVYLDQYVVAEENGRISIYRNWFNDYSKEDIIAIVTSVGFEIKDIWSDLMGSEFYDDSDWIGIACQKPIAL
ncbi:MAG: class I SAM-dependent methyltransferase [Anaerobacillus sp.]|uniref:class I SAM-dependent methyltransferase n=1 Tax=Anaerobacillus sp. TaxID=1872506 RepID=UPI00391CFD82